MIFNNPKIQKFVSGTLVILLLLPALLFFSQPKKAEAVGSGWLQLIQEILIGASTTKISADSSASLAIKLREVAKETLKEVLRGIARRLLNQMTKSTLNWINSGFHGATLFVENPKSFFRDIAKFEVRNFVDTIGYDPTRFPFGKANALN